LRTPKHLEEIVHRDVSPANVILADDGPRLIDFGIASVTGRRAEGTFFTTFGYGSQEQFYEELATPVGPPSDVFSLGATVAFAAIGKHPFGGGSKTVRISDDLPPDYVGDTTVYGLPGEIAAFAEPCLSQSPGPRPTAAYLTGLIGEPGPAEISAYTDVLAGVAHATWGDLNHP
jgi:serine/threonine protein kinase